MKVHAHRAQPTGGQLIEPASIEVETVLPPYPLSMDAMETDAANIALALTTSLPQGTLDRLAVLLVRRLVSDLHIVSNPRARMGG